MIYYQGIFKAERKRMQFHLLPSSLTKERVMPMTTMEVLTLLILVFAVLTYIDNHNKK